MNDLELRFVEAFEAMGREADRVAQEKGWNGVKCPACAGNGYFDSNDICGLWCAGCSGSGWAKKAPSFLERIALCHSELSEALEAYRRAVDNATGRKEALKELADAVIRIMGIFDGKLQRELAIEIVKKINFNATRDWASEGKSI